MTLREGTTIGSYVVLGPLGAGGMGEVYRARDTRLGREVALKLLPEELSRDGERLERFAREARLLASLEHENIARLYGFESVQGEDGGEEQETRFLVMELVSGETLEERLRRGPLALAEAVPLFVEIAEGLEAAHGKGIVHRDLKPSNVCLTGGERARGRVKILDFGLAKTLGADGGGSGAASHSPTLFAVGSMGGQILGTAPYMSPEQARGKEVDQRTDVWAFGCVLFEALAGRRVFEGETVSDVLAAILTAEPPWERLPPGLPSPVRELLARCLVKDPHDRLHHVADARIELERLRGVLGTGGATAALPAVESEPAAAGAAEDAVAARRSSVLGWGGWAGWGVALLLGVGLAGHLLGDRSRRAAADEERAARPVVRFALESHASFFDGATLSSDGRFLAYAAGEDQATTALHVRALDGLEPRVVAEGSWPLFSPDGEEIAYFSQGQLWKVRRDGGAALLLAAPARISGAVAWSEDGFLYFTPSHPVLGGGPETHRLWRVPEVGGVAEPVPSAGEPPLFQAAYQAIPGGRGLLTVVQEDDVSASSDAELFVPATGERRPLVENAWQPAHLPPDVLVFYRDRTLHVARFDLETRELTSEARPAVFDLLSAGNPPRGSWGVSHTGSLVYVEGVAAGSLAELVWVDRHGSVSPAVAEVRNYGAVTLSPDGRTVGVETLGSTDGRDEQWMLDLGSGAWSRPAQEGERNYTASWSPDGEEMVFLSDRDGPLNLYRQPADLSTPPERLVPSPAYQVQMGFSPDGRHLLFEDGRAPGVWVLDRESGEVTAPAEGSPVARGAIFHPSGRFIAYGSQATGSWQIWVRPFPGSGAARQVSLDGGMTPIWSPDGRQLYYRGSGQVMAVPVTVDGESLELGRPEPLFPDTFRLHRFGGTPLWVMHPDGERFLMLRGVESSEARDRIVVVENWLAEVEHLLAR